MKKIMILATGGTIAGMHSKKSLHYDAGVLGIEVLLKELAGIEKIAKISSKQLFNINSKDMSFEKMYEIAKESSEALKEFDGVVITHGSDSLEESAFFLHLLISSKKPIVFTASMRAFNALSSDALKNLYNAIIVAASKRSENKGVLIALNDKIFSALHSSKIHSTNVNAFSSPCELGYIQNQECFFYENFYASKAIFDIKKLTKFEKVSCLMSCVDDENEILAEFLFQNGVKGLVVAGFGSGSMSENLKKKLKTLMKKGLVVMVSSRVFNARISLNDQDIRAGFLSSRTLNPQKARIFLSLALSLAKNKNEFQDFIKRLDD
ncbi:L-asparaginase [Campylobacter sp. MIT 99-7217]|uniref:asparaginase n=1 Tax=Campylobacter sp. MIT 99-7217 TaxID=535091 RepID=UPI00115C3032|nr:asparaginase [Campylobacter sp. MIT 99-7217]TQR30356.1 L-asparaginase [Campylobacter sp. MIT 99-7217]